MSMPEPQDVDSNPALPPNAEDEVVTVSRADRPALSTSRNAGRSTPSPGKGVEDATGPDLGATGSYQAASGPPLPPMSGPTSASPAGAGAEALPGHEVLGVLGRGGMGIVYKARHLRLKRLVAVKMILAGEHAGPEHLARFRTEAEVFARLQHPNIVQIFEVGEHGEMPFLSLEFCGGGSLAKKLAGTPLPPTEAAALVQTLARGMQAAHDKGVIHRDLKPANVLLADDGTPKITDFGLAKKLDEAGQTQTGAVMGTPSYMAPEQADGKKQVGPLTDVYALGAVLYECLTGRPPFKAASGLDTMDQVIKVEPVPPRRLNPAVPRDMETICLKCLQKEPGKRYSSAQALADELDRFLSHKPILARPTTTRERFVKWCRRNPWIALLIVALGFYAVTTTWLSVSLAETTRIANENAKVARNNAKEANRNAETARENEKKANRNAEIATENATIANQRQSAALDHVFRLGRTWAAHELQRQTAQPLSGEPGATRMESFMRVRDALQKMANDKSLSAFARVAALQVAGDFARDLGLLRKALAEYQQAYNLVKGITQEQPDEDKARANMAVMLLRLGNITWEMSGDVAMARKAFEKARELRQEIADHPRSRGYTALDNRIALAYCALDRGRLELSQGNLTAARTYLARALEARRAWVEEVKGAKEEERAMALSFLSETCMWMGVVLAHQGDQEDADKHLKEAVELCEQGIEQYKKEITFFQKDLADIHEVRGDVQALRGDWDGASASYAKAQEHVLAANLPGTPEDAAGQVLLARTFERLGAAADKKGDAKDAKGRRKMSLEIRETLTRIEPDCVSWKAAWLLALAHMDRQADDEAATLAKRAAGNCELLLQLARYHAIRAGKAAAPAQRRAAAEQALALLGDAVKAGYADRFLLAGDPDLASLRQEAGFQALLNRLAR
jgi:eukaryotic-like serine/threonine-protein kinase